MTSPMARNESARLDLDRDFPKLGDSKPSVSFATEREQSTSSLTEKTDLQSVKKSKRPILLEISPLLEVKSKPKCNKTDKLQPSSVQISGNPLDSSSPIRYKGKQREHKKPELSRLKKEILKDRLYKKCGKSNERLTNNADSFNQAAENSSKKLTEDDDHQKKIISSSSYASKIVIHTSASKSINFSSKFKRCYVACFSYCENILTPELNATVEKVVRGLVQLQDNAFHRNPLRARAHKRYVLGLRETIKYLKLGKAKLIIIAPDLESSPPDGAISQCLLEIKSKASQENVQIVFALHRRRLGNFSKRSSPVSAITVLSFEGLEKELEELLNAFEVARVRFIQEMVTEPQVEVLNNVANTLENVSLGDLSSRGEDAVTTKILQKEVVERNLPTI